MKGLHERIQESITNATPTKETSVKRLSVKERIAIRSKLELTQGAHFKELYAELEAADSYVMLRKVMTAKKELEKELGLGEKEYLFSYLDSQEFFRLYKEKGDLYYPEVKARQEGSFKELFALAEAATDYIELRSVHFLKKKAEEKLGEGEYIFCYEDGQAFNDLYRSQKDKHHPAYLKEQAKIVTELEDLILECDSNTELYTIKNFCFEDPHVVGEILSDLVSDIDVKIDVYNKL